MDNLFTKGAMPHLEYVLTGMEYVLTGMDIWLSAHMQKTHMYTYYIPPSQLD